MIDVETMIKALRLAWILRLCTRKKKLENCSRLLSRWILGVELSFKVTSNLRRATLVDFSFFQ